MTDFVHRGDRRVHTGHIWDVVVASFEAPDGTVFERDIVRSPGAVAVVPVLLDGDRPETVLIRQYRAPFDRMLVEIPAGMRDVADEPTELTAERELIEEVGLRPGRLELLTEMIPSAGLTDSVTTIFVATDLEPVDRQPHGPEEAASEIIRLPLDEALAQVRSGEINEAKTALGLLLAAAWLDGRH